MVEAHDISTPDGRTIRAYDAGGTGPALLWHHGSPQSGELLEPLLVAAAARGIRLLGYARPGYGGSTSHPGRDVAGAAADVAAVVDALGVDRFAVMGASGGGPHVLACAALLPERITAAVTLAGIAPRTDGDTADDDWFAGMAAPGSLRAATQGRAARAAFEEDFDESQFIAADWAILSGAWRALGADADRASRDGMDGLIDDDVAFAAPWGFDLAAVTTPVLLVQGGLDRVVPPSHARRLADAIGTAQLWSRPQDGHVSVLAACAVAMDWCLDVPA